MSQQPSRRGLLGGAAAVLAAGAAAVLAATPAPAGGVPAADAELIRLCAEHDALERQQRNMFPGGATPIKDDDERDELIEPIWKTQDRLRARIIDLEATTLAGFKARARTACLYDPDLMEAFEEGDASEALVGALLLDLLDGNPPMVREQADGNGYRRWVLAGEAGA